MQYKYYDKAKWQIDGGTNETLVRNHFKTVYNWLYKKGFLNEDGLEEYKINEPDDYSESILVEEFLTEEGNIFFRIYYNQYLTLLGDRYGKDENAEILDTMYKQYIRGSNVAKYVLIIFVAVAILVPIIGTINYVKDTNNFDDVYILLCILIFAVSFTTILFKIAKNKR